MSSPARPAAQAVPALSAPEALHWPTARRRGGGDTVAPAACACAPAQAHRTDMAKTAGFINSACRPLLFSPKGEIKGALLTVRRLPRPARAAPCRCGRLASAWDDRWRVDHRAEPGLVRPGGTRAFAAAGVVGVAMRRVMPISPRPSFLSSLPSLINATAPHQAAVCAGFQRGGLRCSQGCCPGCWPGPACPTSGRGGPRCCRWARALRLARPWASGGLADRCWAVAAHSVPWANQAAVVTHLRASSVKWCAVAPRPARI